MTGITCALFDEAWELIRRLDPVKKNGVHCFQGTLARKEVSLFLTRPGLKKNSNNFIKWIEGNSFSNIIFSGFCGALSSNYAVGDICTISDVFSISSDNSFKITGKSLHKIITVNEPVLDMSTRDELQLKYHMDLVDMESAVICDIMKKAFPTIPFKIVKIVGDVPGEDDLMKHEIAMRAYFSTFGFRNKLKIALKTGLPFFSLYKRKRLLQKTLKTAIEAELRNEFI
jgi:nucleoside phosphorylase